VATLGRPDPGSAPKRWSCPGWGSEAARGENSEPGAHSTLSTPEGEGEGVGRRPRMPFLHSFWVFPLEQEKQNK
jgi:hypothetical protein